MSDSSHHSKSSNGIRKFLSFVLFILIVFASISICGRIEFTNPVQVEKSFTGYAYLSALREDVVNYAKDKYSKNGISAENVDGIITYDIVRNAMTAYISYELQSDMGYSQKACDEYVAQVNASLAEDIELQAEDAGFKADKKIYADTAENISGYMKEKITVVGMNYIQSVTNVGKLVFTILSVVCSICMAVILLILLFVGQNRYRSVRYISISFISAGIFDLLLSAVVSIIFSIKSVDVYPVYLKTAFDAYVSRCISSVSVAGLLLLVIAVVLSVIVWKIKRKEL